MKTDICLILEGTYPYTHGGVSSWIHRLVNAFSDFTFSIIYISSTGDVPRRARYEIPPNILEFREIFIHDLDLEKGRTHGSPSRGWQAIRKFYEGVAREDYSGFEDVYKYLVRPETRALNTHDILHDQNGWRMLLEYANKQVADYSFVDFYWTMRFIHLPLLKLFRAQVPEASLYHAVCTGYAGALAVITKMEKKVPFVLTEHGIYTHERKIEIARARWIQSETDNVMRATRKLGFLKDIWIKKFEVLSRLAYNHADKIVTLFEGNRRMQIEGGADPAKTSVIPNGIQIPERVRPPRKKSDKVFTVGFVGRIVPIKDVKTLIRAVKIAQSEIPGISVQILGDGAETPEYFEECRTLSRMLGLENVIQFVGNVDVEAYYPKMDVVVLTSISEAQPLSLLEAMGHGIPVVTSNVGACREIALGRTEDDRHIGAAGIVTDVGEPHQTAEGIIRLYKDPEMWEGMSRAGRKRVERFYRVEDMLGQYRKLYSGFVRQRALAGWNATSPGG
jgi:glycosyltransferase involved in cell wall biosynthesis